jgi:MoxR-like ATPase
MQPIVEKVIEQINQVILGKEKQVEEIMLAFLANGHILLEDIPGVGKTTMAIAFSKAIGLDYKRIQFTPDVLPSDLTGFSIYQRNLDKFVYQEGSVFCNLLLADELNRTSPKTQSALLEVMEERKVTVEGTTRDVPSPFIVIATQNPHGNAGTQLLPEAQIDRFMIQMTIGYPDFDSELAMAHGIGDENRMEQISPVMTGQDLQQVQKEIAEVFVHESISRYIVELVRATRTHDHLVQGVSPRATISLVRMAKARAWLMGRDYVIPNDVEEQFPYVINHRMELSTTAKMNHVTREMVIAQILQNASKPSIGEKQ